MKISLILPERNAQTHVVRILASLKRQTLCPDEVVVVDSSSDDRSAEVARTGKATVYVIAREAFDHGGTRTFAARKAMGDILVYITHDVIFADAYALENLIQPIVQTPSIAAAFGRQLPQEGAGPFARHLRLFNYPATSHVRHYADRTRFGFKTAFLSNAFAAYRKSALEEIGYFKEHLVMCEDVYAAAKLLLAGHHIAYRADAQVYHSHHYTIRQEFTKYFDIGVFHAQEHWILERFGRVDGEGLRYLKSEWSYLIQNGFLLSLPEFILRNFAKWSAYRLGRLHRVLPRRLAQSLSMWDKSKNTL